MLPVYSKVFFRQAGFTGVTTLTVPSGFVWVVRDVDVYADISDLGRVDFFLSELATNAAFVWFNWSSGEQNLKMWRGRQVIAPLSGAGGLTIKNDGGEGCDVSISGYELSEP